MDAEQSTPSGSANNSMDEVVEDDSDYLEEADIQKLRQQLTKERALRKKADRRQKEAEREKQEAQREKQEAEREKQEAEHRQKEAEHRQKETELLYRKTQAKLAQNEFIPAIYLRHQLMLARLSVETNPHLLSKGGTTSVLGKYYPRTVRKWIEFPSIHKRVFSKVSETFGNKKLFPSMAALTGVYDTISTSPVGSELALEPYERQFETGIKEMANKYLEAVATNPPSQVGFYPDLVSLANRQTASTKSSTSRISTRTNSPDASDPIEGSPRALSSGTAGGLKPSPVFKTETRPDKWCLRKDQRPTSAILPGVDITAEVRTPILVLDYKALHKVPPNVVMDMLGNDAPEISLLADLRNLPSKPTAAGDGQNISSALIRANVAASLVQLFHYLVFHGLQYGYLSTGEGLILLHFDPGTPTTMYYHLATPKVDVDVPPLSDDAEECRELAYANHDALSNTAIAKVLTLTMLALPQDPQQEVWETSVRPELKKWPRPYQEPKANMTLRSSSRKRRKDDDETRGAPPAPSRSQGPRKDSTGDKDSGGSRQGQGGTQQRDQGRQQERRIDPRCQENAEGPDDSVVASNLLADPVEARRPPKRDFCTQKCLDGLRRAGHVDGNCPNVDSHQSSNGHHSLSRQRLAYMIRRQFEESFVNDWEALDKFGMYGAVGALFKVTLHEYGYTMVAKGVQAVDRWRLDKEAQVYDRLDDLQGRSVPVCLGVVDLAKPYLLYTGARIVKLLLMSFGGINLVMAQNVMVDVEGEWEVIVEEIGRRGVAHNDVRPYNVLWSAEIGGLMAIDFDRAYIRDMQGKRRRASGSSDDLGPDSKRGSFGEDGEVGQGVVRGSIRPP